MEPMQTPLVARVSKNSPASLARIQANDIIREANGIRIYNPQTLVDIIDKNPGKPITLKIERGTSEFETSVVPVVPESVANSKDIPAQEKHAMIGLGWEAGGKRNIDHADPFWQSKHG